MLHKLKNMQHSQIDIKIYDATITLPPDKVAVNVIRIFFDKLARKEASDFCAEFYKTFSDLEDLYIKCDYVMHQIRLRAIDEGMKFITSYGIFDLSEQRFFEKFLQAYDSYEVDFDVVGRQYEAILEETAILDAYRTARRKNRRMWIGFTEAAVYSADAKNMWSNIAHGSFNMMAKGVTSIANSIKKDEIFRDKKTINQLGFAAYKIVISVLYAVIDVINYTCQPCIHNYSDDEISRANAIVENVRKGRVPPEDIKIMLLKGLEFYPYNEDIYELLLRAYGDESGTLERAANYFGLTRLSAVKEELMAQEWSRHDFSTLDAYDRNLPNIKQFADSISYAKDFTESGQHENVFQYSSIDKHAEKIKKPLIEKAFKLKLAATDLSTLDACDVNLKILKKYAEEIGYQGFEYEIPGILKLAVVETFNRAVKNYDLSTPDACKTNLPKLEALAKKIGYPDFNAWSFRVLVDIQNKFFNKVMKFILQMKSLKILT